MNYSQNKVLILGGDSGIGIGLYKKFEKDNFNIFTSVRNIKKKSYNGNFFQLDYFDSAKKKFNIKKNFKKNSFDYVLFLAGITPQSKYINNKKCEFGNLDYQNFLKIVTVNCYANIKIFEILKKKKLLKNNARIVFFSSLAGSIEKRGKLIHNKPFGNIFYRISKSALNSGVKNLSYDFNEKYIIVSMHPGFVKTKSGGSKADYSINYAVNKIYKTIINLKNNDNGKFLNLNGKKIKW